MDILDERFRALAHPVRRAILVRTRDRELTAGELAGYFDISRPGVSQHISTLLETGLLRVRRTGTRRYYAVDRNALGDLRVFFESFGDESLERLQAAVETDHALHGKQG